MIRASFLAIFAFCIVIVTSSAQVPRIMTPGDFHEQEFKRIVDRLQRFESDEPTPNQANMDVVYYRISIDDLDIPSQTIWGNCTMTAKALVDNYTATELDFAQVMTVDSVVMVGQDCGWSHSNDMINLTWSTGIDSGQAFTFVTYYHGQPQMTGFGSFSWSTHNGIPVVSTLSEPEGSRDWWPCKDVPNDKADSVDMLIRADDAYISTSNGELREMINHGDGTKTYHWHHGYPISTYLVCLNTTNYQILTDQYVTLASDTMPLMHYVYPEDVADALIDFDITVPAIETYRDLFGEYPFVNESYGMSEFSWNGGMEHQTLTSYGRILIRGDHYYDYILVHELSHQWFGDAITMDDWPDIWLNEGFASYCEAVWKENISGLASYHSYMRTRLSVYDPSGPIYDPATLFSSNTVYHKGAWVLHMLRGFVGDDIFTILRNYREQYEYDNATSEDFRHAAEAVWGDDLGWFFDEWLLGVNRPDYLWSWDVGQWGGVNHVFVDIVQQQTNADLFTMPIHFRLFDSAHDTTLTLWDSLASQTFSAEIPWLPTGAEFDPDQWILRFEAESPYNLTIITDSLPMSVVGEPYSDSLHAVGGIEPYAWGLSAGALPDGLVLDPSSGVISGIPLSEGFFVFTISLLDDGGSQVFRDFSLEILRAPNAIGDLVIQRQGIDVELQWSPVEFASGYTVYRGSTYGNPPDSLTTTTDTTFVDPAVLNSLPSAYYYVTSQSN